MVPVINETYSIVRQQTYEKQPVGAVIDNIKQAKDPIHRFLARHSSDREKMFFVKTARLMWPQELAQGVTKDDFLVLIPAFTVSELTTAFQIGFLIYLPFIAIDLVVSNILLALGMMMVSPMTISLPFKLLLFVLIEGWSRLIQGLVLSYK
jgi:type III secretion protein R